MNCNFLCSTCRNSLYRFALQTWEIGLTQPYLASHRPFVPSRTSVNSSPSVQLTLNSRVLTLPVSRPGSSPEILATCDNEMVKQVLTETWSVAWTLGTFWNLPMCFAHSTMQNLYILPKTVHIETVPACTSLCKWCISVAAALLWLRVTTRNKRSKLFKM